VATIETIAIWPASIAGSRAPPSDKGISVTDASVLGGQRTMEIYNPNLSEAARRLEENLSLLNPATHRTARNLSFALLAICRELDRMGRDVERNTSMLSATLKELSDDHEFARETVRKKP